MNAVMLTIAPSVVFKKVGDETVLLDFDAGVYYGLDSVGARVWELLADGQTVPRILDVLMDEYEVAREVLEHDVAALLADLVASGLVRKVEP